MKLLLPIALALTSLTSLAQIPSPITTDPPADAANPASMGQIVLPSHGANLNGLIYVASGAGPHPTVVLLHGFPGYEQNLDLAQTIRRAGWDVVFFHYRGSWGSQGAFSFANSIEDTQAAIDWIRDPRNAKKFRMDPGKIVLIGHSMGGFMSAIGGAKDSRVLGVAMLAAWNIGGDAKNMKDVDARKKDTEEQLRPLSGCTADGLIAEMSAHKDDWDYNSFVPQLKARPVLVISTNDNLRGANDSFVAAMKAGGATRVTAVHFPTDHGLNDHRIALQQTVLEWLKGMQQ